MKSKGRTKWNATTKSAGMAAIAVACAACCAAGVMPAAIAGIGVVAAGAAFWAWGLAVGAIVLTTGIYLFARRRAALKPPCNALTATENRCGGVSCVTADSKETVL